MRVQPTEPVARLASPRPALVIAGGLWLTATLALSISYLSMQQRPLANDLFWPGYNASGYQTFLIDFFNGLLETTPDGSTVDFGAVMLEARYDTLLTTAIVHPTYAMALLTTKLTSLDTAILSLRNTTLAQVAWLPTQYCWVDFHKAFELAHTEMRQDRCHRRYASNGAVYLDSAVRNVKRSSLLSAWNGSGSSFWSAIPKSLEGSAVGERWLQSVVSVQTNVRDEVTHWQLRGITVYHYQWQSVSLPGLVETATLINALGMQTSLTLKSSVNREGSWTTTTVSSLLDMDLQFAAICNTSLVRGAPNYILTTSCSGPEDVAFESFMGLSLFDPKVGLIRDTLGPFLSIDMNVVPVPRSVVAVITAFLAKFHEALTPSSAALYRNLDALVVTPVPMAWSSDLLFYGGSPFCRDGSPQMYVQPPFTAMDECFHQRPWTVRISPRSLVVALALANDSIDVICAQQSLAGCMETLVTAQQLLPRRHIDHTMLENATADVAALNVSLLQFASDVTATNYTLLLQPLLGRPFAFYGWVLILDWVAGRREVISLQGDNGTLVLISDAYDTTSTTPTSAVLGTSSIGFYYVTLYSTCVLGALAVTTLVAATKLRHDIAGSHFFAFNRVAGSTWLGRPLLLLRGVSAIVLLSSAPIGLTQTHNVFAQLALPRRPIWETFIIAWEATWVSYVLHELLLPLRPPNALLSGTLDTGLVWLCTLIIDIGWPVSVTSKVNRECSIVDDAFVLSCASMVVQTGDRQRLLLLTLLQCLLLPCLWLYGRSRVERPALPNIQEARLPLVGQAFFAPRPQLDIIVKMASGLLPLWHSTYFDLKLWRLLIESPTRQHVATDTHGPLVHKANRWGPRAWVVVGTVYVITAIYSSVSYLGLAQKILTNDLVWPTFDMTGSHSFLANWLNEPSHVLGSKGSTIALTNNQKISAFGLFNQSHASVAFPIQQGARVQYSTLTSLSDAISSLRKTDGCDGPWVFTQYCYLDFDQKWEMANSAKRQERCKSMVNNGAVFLASLLRNVDISACWGDSFEVGFGSELRQSTAGQAILASFSPPYVFINDEVSYWTQKGIKSYVLQWQNYKSIGLLHLYNIVNAYGAVYPFSLQSTAGYYRMERQTSSKMYWSLANDLGTLVKNTSTMGGRILLRSSSRFAFQNMSLQGVLIEENVLPELPWSANYVLVSSYLGPFGSIDMVYVSVPLILQETITAFAAAVATVHRLYPERYEALGMPSALATVPFHWRQLRGITASMLCPDQPRNIFSALPWVTGMDAFERTCSDVQRFGRFKPSAAHNLFAVHFSNLSTSTNTSTLCAISAYGEKHACPTSIASALVFLKELPALPNNRQSISAAIHALNIEWVQFGAVNKTAPVGIFHTLVLDPSDPRFDYYAWIFLYDWAIGNREVISFQGDHNTLTLMGAALTQISQPVDNAQLPTVFALYALQAVRYVTFVMIMLAAVTFVYILLARGHVEGLNMFEMSRVGGIVWVGRPLVAVRSITALCLLSTASIELQSDGVFSYFVKTPVPLWTTCLAANEVTWLVGIVNDISLVWTQDHTIAYTTINSLLMWLISALLATLAPVQATITVSPVCEIATLDYQVVCVAGNVVIGSLERLLTLVGIVVVCNGVCFGLVRCFWKRPLPRVSSSMLLGGGAKYLFSHDKWMDEDGTYFLDRASAVLNGLLSVRYQNQWIVFDIKTWCVHKLQVASNHACYAIPSTDCRFGHALPLRDDTSSG